MDWTQQWKQEGWQEKDLDSEQRLLLRLIRRRFGGTIAAQSVSVLGQIEQLVVFEDLGEEIFDCADETAWLVMLARRTD